MLSVMKRMGKNHLYSYIVLFSSVLAVKSNDNCCAESSSGQDCKWWMILKSMKYYTLPCYR